MPDPWYRGAFGGEYHDAWVQRGATTWNLTADTLTQVEFLLRAVAPEPGCSVLDLACGHGRHAVELARRGYAVTGLDLSAELLAIARAAAEDAGVNVRWIEADMRDAPAGPFDLAFVMDTSFGYFPDEEDDQRVLSALHDALRPGGTLFLDVLNRDAFVSAEPPFWRELPGGDLLLLDRTLDFLTSRLRIDARLHAIDGSRSDRSFDIRLYTARELTRMLARAGFAVGRMWGGFNGSPPAAHRSRLLVMAQRR